MRYSIIRYTSGLLRVVIITLEYFVTYFVENNIITMFRRNEESDDDKSKTLSNINNYSW